MPNRCRLAWASPLRGLQASRYRANGRSEVPGHLGRLVPCELGVRGELRAVVAHDQTGLATTGDDGVEFTRHAPSRDRAIRDRRNALVRGVIDDLRMRKHGPSRTGRGRGRATRSTSPRPGSRPGCLWTVYGRACDGRRDPLPMEALGPIPVQYMPFAAQQHVQASTAKVALLGSQLTQSLSQTCQEIAEVLACRISRDNLSRSCRCDRAYSPGPARRDGVPVKLHSVLGPRRFARFVHLPMRSATCRFRGLLVREP